MANELLAKVTEMADKFKTVSGEHADRLKELEMRSARAGNHENDNYVPHGGPSIGQLIIDSDEAKNLNSGFRGSAKISLPNVELATITSGTGSVGATASSGTSLVPAQRLPGIVTPYQRQLRLRDVINTAQTTSNSIEWPRETGYTNAARPVTETTTKPYSDLTFNLVTSPVRTIAHMFKASRQILDDAPALAAYINRRGTYGLQLVEEQQILTGNGAGQNLNGIVPQATAFTPTFTVDNETAIDRILEAISQAEDAEVPVNAVILNRRDWRRLTATKSTQGEYISSQSPFGLTDPRLWGVSIVPTNAMAPGEFLAGSFSDGATIFDRMGVEVLLSSENVDDFEKNLVSIRIESRLALAVFKPEAFVSGDLYVTTD